MAVALVSRWARRYVAVAVLALAAAHVAVLVDAPTRTVVTLALYGFVLHVVFGKAYSLVPSYFDRELAAPRAMVAQLPLTALGALGVAVAPLAGVPGAAAVAGGVLWAFGVATFVGALAWTIRSNLSGAATATGEGKAHLAGLDRVANAFVPVALAYLLAGTYATLVAVDAAPAVLTGLVPVFDGYAPRATHLLGAGTAALLVFALGARLFPRFLVAPPPRPLFVAALACGSVGPVALAATLPAGPGFGAAAALQALAVTAYALAFLALYRRSDRDRVAFRGVLAGAVAGVAAVAVGAWFAVSGVDAGLLVAHRRLALLGFLGLTVVGATLQFYPPSVGGWRWCTTRTANVAIGALATGVALQAAGAAGAVDAVGDAGAVVGLVGVSAYGYLLAGAFATR